MKALSFIIFLLIGICSSCKSEVSPVNASVDKQEQFEIQDSNDNQKHSSGTTILEIKESNDPEIKEVLSDEEEGATNEKVKVDIVGSEDKIDVPGDHKIDLEEQKEIEEVDQNQEHKEDNIETENNDADPQSEIEEDIEIPVAFNIHDPLDALLKKFVSQNGNVDYAGLKNNESSLDSYLETISESGIKSNWSKEAKMAFWINAYNAYTIKLILNNYPTSSIMNISSGKAWDVSWIKIGGKSYSLNDIEHKILRPVYKDARIHFAVNCAAKSCPPLYNGAWTEGNLESLLDNQTRKFINNKAFNTISSDKMILSKIFEWYKDDFNNLSDFIGKYTSIKINSKTKIKFKNYDWALNE